MQSPGFCLFLQPHLSPLPSVNPTLREPQSACGSGTQHSFPGSVPCPLSVILPLLDTFHHAKIHPIILNNLALPAFPEMNGDVPFTMNSLIILYAKPCWSATVFYHLPCNHCVSPSVGFKRKRTMLYRAHNGFSLKVHIRREEKWHSFIQPFSI